MKKEIRTVAGLIAVLVVFLGLVYPLVMVLYARVSPGRADGGIIYVDGKAVGAGNIGQEFTSDAFFHGRPSAGSYDAMKSGASNLGPTNPKLMAELNAQIRKLLRENPGLKVEEIPVELITSSGSGLDPHISVKSAQLQVERVSKATGIAAPSLKKMIERHTAGRFLGILGEPRVNVLELNLEVLKGSKGVGR